MENSIRQKARRNPLKFFIGGLAILIMILIIVVAVSSYFDLQDSNRKNMDILQESKKRTDEVLVNKIDAYEQRKANVEIASEKVKDDGGGWGSIVGEVKNTGQIPVSFVKITITYYDRDNKVEDTDFTYAGDTADVNLLPDETSPFKATFDKGTLKFDHYKLDITWNNPAN
jgi:hypothetical protein